MKLNKHLNKNRDLNQYTAFRNCHAHLIVFIERNRHAHLIVFIERNHHAHLIVFIERNRHAHLIVFSRKKSNTIAPPIIQIYI